MLVLTLLLLAAVSISAPILARHTSGICLECRNPIRKGELIVFDEGRQEWVHDECAPVDEDER
jgi:uncharacterized Fe-S cluster protein YjdI